MFNMIILDESSLKPLKTFGDRLAGARRVECWAQEAQLQPIGKKPIGLQTGHAAQKKQCANGTPIKKTETCRPSR